MAPKTITIFLILAITPTAYSMDKIDKMEIVGTDEPKECYLAQVPTEVLDHIAQHLPFHDRESDAEAVERTTPHLIDGQQPWYQCITQEHWIQFAVHDTTRLWPPGRTLGSYSSDQSKIIFMRKYDWQEHPSLDAPKPKVAILDIGKNTIMLSERVATLAAMDRESVSHIALSRNGSLFAELQSQVDNTQMGIGVMHYKNALVIKNSITNGMEEFEIPGHFGSIVAIGFNKQSTELILHGSCRSHIVPLIVLLTTQEEHEAKSKKTFHEYCRQHWICKNINVLKPR